MTFGPMQLLVVGFDGTEFTGTIAAELRRLREQEIVRLVDLIVVRKDADGDVAVIEATDLTADETTELGAFAGALIGLADDSGGSEQPGSDFHDEIWFVADAIPPGTTAAVAVLEHRWAIPLRDTITAAGGRALADAWLHPDDIAALAAHLPQGATTG